MLNSVNCFVFKGEGKALIKYKQQTKAICSKLTSYVHISTCQRVEIYTNLQIPYVGMDLFEYPSSLEHLTQVLSGIDSGLFGEIEIYKQIQKSVETASEENHLTLKLQTFFDKAFLIADEIRSEFKLNNSWITAIEKVLQKNDILYIFGKGNLATQLENYLKKQGNFTLVADPELATTLIILQKDFPPLDSFLGKTIINLTETKIKEDEIKMRQFFQRPDEKILEKIQKRIREKISSET